MCQHRVGFHLTSSAIDQGHLLLTQAEVEVFTHGFLVGELCLWSQVLLLLGAAKHGMFYFQLDERAGGLYCVSVFNGTGWRERKNRWKPWRPYWKRRRKRLLRKENVCRWAALIFWREATSVAAFLTGKSKFTLLTLLFIYPKGQKDTIAQLTSKVQELEQQNLQQLQQVQPAEWMCFGSAACLNRKLFFLLYLTQRICIDFNLEMF